MTDLKPTTPEGRDRVARLLEPVVLEAMQGGLAAADLYVVLLTTCKAMRLTVLDRGREAELEALDALVKLEVARWAAGS